MQRIIIRGGILSLVGIVVILVVPSPTEHHIVSTIIYGLFALTFTFAILQGTLTIYLSGLGMRLNWQMRQQWRRNPQAFILRDISSENPELDHPIALEFIEELEQLGFARLGTGQNDYFTEYIYTNEEMSVGASVRPRSEQVVQLYFGTYFDDEFFLETGYYGNLRLEKPLLQLHSLHESIAATYDYHLGEMNRLMAEARQPQALQSFSQYIERAELYWSRYLLLENTTMVRGLVKKLAIALLITGIGVTGLILVKTMAEGLMLIVLTLALLGLGKIKIAEFQPVERKKRKPKG